MIAKQIGHVNRDAHNWSTTPNNPHDAGLDFTLDDLAELDPGPAPAHRTRAYQPNAKHTTTGVTVQPALKFRNPFTPAHHAQVLQEALKLAAQGIYVVLLHAPIFNNAGDLVGCTCEAWKRSKKHQKWLQAKHDEGKCKHLKYDPAFKCPTPGKHPRLLDWEAQASIDPVQIHKWFARWPQSNLGIAPGKSGLVVVDGDAYKDNYAGADLISRDDEQTPTTLTGKRGAHWYFQKPEGKTYTNANNTLPDGVDIRCDGGMVVVYPSIHPNGNQYEWENGYSIFEIDPLPLPKALETLLDDAQAKSAPAQAVTFTTPTTEEPQLGQWKLPKKILDLIFAPAPADDRSQTDMRIVVALVYAGATDDNILAVFEHCPIGVNGKFAQRGRDYLALTIGKARTYAAANPRPDVTATVAQMRLWIRTHTFEGHAPSSADGIYRTDAIDTKIADAVFDRMAKSGMLAVNVGKNLLGKLAGVGPNTALRAITRLNGWLFDVTPDPNGAHIALVDNARLQRMDPLLTIIPLPTIVGKGGPFVANDICPPIINEYSPRKADEPFLAGTSKAVKDAMKKAAAATDTTFIDARNAYTFVGLGESSLRVLDALTRCGDMTAQELVEETGKKLSSIRTACRRLVQHGLLHAFRPNARTAYTYSLAENVWSKIDGVAPQLRNYKLTSQREDRRLVGAIQWAMIEKRTTQDKEERLRLDRKIDALCARRIPHLTRLYEELSREAIRFMAYDVAVPPGPHPATQAKLDRLHATARIDVAETKRAEGWKLTNTVQQLRAEGDSKKEAARKMQHAGYTANEAWTAVQQVWRVAGGGQ